MGTSVNWQPDLVCPGQGTKANGIGHKHSTTVDQHCCQVLDILSTQIAKKLFSHMLRLRWRPLIYSSSKEFVAAKMNGGLLRDLGGLELLINLVPGLTSTKYYPRG